MVRVASRENGVPPNSSNRRLTSDSTCSASLAAAHLIFIGRGSKELAVSPAAQCVSGDESSAIWTASVAAPLRRLSTTGQIQMLSLVKSFRMRPTMKGQHTDETGRGSTSFLAYKAGSVRPPARAIDKTNRPRWVFGIAPSETGGGS